MKKIGISIITCILCISINHDARAEVDIKVSGTYFISGSAYGNLDFADEADNQNGNENNGFNVYNRLRLNMDISNSENLSARIRIHAPDDTIWGDGAFSAGGGSFYSQRLQENDLFLILAHIDYYIPQTEILVRMGLQNISFNTALGSAILSDEVAGVSVHAPINKNINISAQWFRPYLSDDFLGNEKRTDVFALSLPITYEDFSFTPWFLYGLENKNGVYANTDSINTQNLLGESNYWLGFNASMNFHNNKLGNIKLDIGFVYSYAENIYNNYISNLNNLRNSQAWLVDAALSYHGNYMKTMLFGWYASGDTKDVLNNGNFGRMASISAEWDRVYSTFFDQSIYEIAPTSNVSSPSGTWGLGLSLTGFEPIKKVNMGGHIMYVQGTNDKALLDSQTFLNKNPFNPNYLTQEDSLWEFSAYSTYDIYKNLQASLTFAYIIPHLSNDWQVNERNAYRAIMAFKYSF